MRVTATKTHLSSLVAVQKGFGQNVRTIRSFGYDTVGRLTGANNPESGTTSYTYDKMGNVITKTDARNVVSNYSYDVLNRVTQIGYSDGTPAVTYGYDIGSNAKGHVTSIGKSGSTTIYSSFDSVGNILSSSQTTAGQTYTFGYTYSLAGDLLTETYPSSRVVTTGYDGADRPNTVTGQLAGTLKTYLSFVTYAPHGSLSRLDYGNGVVRNATYTTRLQPGCWWDTNNNDSNSFLFQGCPDFGTADNNGNLKSLTISAGGPAAVSALPNYSATYQYDKLNRLASAQDTGWSRTFKYDENGNMWVATSSGVNVAGNTPMSNVFNSQNRIAASSYDLAGNQTSVNGNTVSYDAENHQIKATEPTSMGEGSEAYLFDGLGQRVQKSGPAGTLVYVYDALGPFGCRILEHCSGGSSLSDLLPELRSPG